MNRPFPWIQAILFVVSFVVFVLWMGPMVATKIRGQITPVPTTIVYDQPGVCYSTHVLPPANEVARTIFTTLEISPDFITAAYWQVRGENHDVWIKIFFIDSRGDGIFFADLICGYWPEEDATPGRQRLLWGEFYIDRPELEPA